MRSGESSRCGRSDKEFTSFRLGMKSRLACPPAYPSVKSVRLKFNHSVLGPGLLSHGFVTVYIFNCKISERQTLLLISFSGCVFVEETTDGPRVWTFAVMFCVGSLRLFYILEFGFPSRAGILWTFCCWFWVFLMFVYLFDCPSLAAACKGLCLAWVMQDIWLQQVEPRLPALGWSPLRGQPGDPPIDISRVKMLCCGGCLGIVECLAAFLASTHWMPIGPPPKCL